MMEATISAQLDHIIEALKPLKNLNDTRLIETSQKVASEGIRIKDNFWENIIVQGAGAFLGAFFAFLFGLLTLWIQKLRERFILHKNAVVELEYLLNEHLNDIAKNGYLIKHDISILSNANLTYDRLYPLRLPHDLELRLADLDIINKYFSYKESVLRINADLKKINDALDNINNVIISRGTIHKNNFTHIVQQMEILNKFLSLLTEECKYLLAFTRVYLRRIHSFKAKRGLIYKLNSYKTITEEEIKDELKVLEGEVHEVMNESRKKIEKTLEQ